LNGVEYDIDPVEARSRLQGHPAEPIQTHWVEIDGRRWPPKQALEVISGVQRTGFTSHRASDILSRLGLATSRDGGKSGDGPAVGAQAPRPPGRRAPSRHVLRDAVEHLADFMDGLPLTTRVATLEHALLGADMNSAAAIADDHDVASATLDAALAVRDAFGRVSDVIHAFVITLALPRILEPGETVTVRPSLAAGNDPSRRFDLETDRRVAEFKVSGWSGTDATRKRGAFVDLVHVALDDSPREKYVYVLGKAPRRFLETTTSTAAWGFTRKSALQRNAFEKRWGPAESISIADFRRDHASRVHIVDLYDVIPELRGVHDDAPNG
jgi:hypothetical protein